MTPTFIEMILGPQRLRGGTDFMKKIEEFCVEQAANRSSKRVFQA